MLFLHHYGVCCFLLLYFVLFIFNDRPIYMNPLQHHLLIFPPFPYPSFHPLFPFLARMNAARLRRQTWQSAASWSVTDWWPWKMNCRRPYSTGIRPSLISFHSSLNYIHHINCMLSVCVFLSLCIHLQRPSFLEAFQLSKVHIQTTSRLTDVLWLYLSRKEKSAFFIWHYGSIQRGNWR